MRDPTDRDDSRGGKLATVGSTKDGRHAQPVTGRCSGLRPPPMWSHDQRDQLLGAEGDRGFGEVASHNRGRRFEGRLSWRPTQRTTGPLRRRIISRSWTVAVQKDRGLSPRQLYCMSVTHSDTARAMGPTSGLRAHDGDKEPKRSAGLTSTTVLIRRATWKVTRKGGGS